MNRQEPRPFSIGSRISRRGFLHTAATVTATVAVQSSPARTAEVRAQPLIDTNVSLGQWPFRHTEPSNTASLVAELRKQGVSQAWVSSLDALLHKDLSSVNVRLANECKQHAAAELIPFVAINPKLPDWEEDLRRCDEVHRMRGIRLYPNYHGYQLNDPDFRLLLQRASERKMLVQIAVIMEEERTLHPLVEVPATDTTPLSKTLKEFPKLRLQLLNAFRTLKDSDTDSLASLGVYFEIAMLEGLSGVENLLKQVPLSNLCFGSYSPVFYFDSARRKLQESELAGVQKKAICSENAFRLLNKA
jgi:predicted TIM-barrel fold metal-dependent hydrolase